MIDDKFSVQSFQKAGYGSDKAQEISQDLEKQIMIEIDKVIRSALHNIINKLNLMGHSLVLESKSDNICDITYIDPQNDERSYPRYKFLVGVDAVISVGYPDTVGNNTREEEGGGRCLIVE